MSNKKILYSEGELIITSYGEYSDYGFDFALMVLKDFNIHNMLQMWITLGVEKIHLNDDGTINTYESEISNGDSIHGAFLNWLVSMEVLKKMKYRELHTGSYGELEFMEYTNE